MADSDLHKQMDDIRNDVASLRSDLSVLIESLRDEGIERGQASYRAAHDRVEHAAEQIHERLESAQDAVGNQIELRPFTSLLTSFGIGFAIGLLLDRRR